MDNEALVKLLEHATVRLKNGEKVEEAKLELKREWPNLCPTDTQSRQIAESEFLKDLVGLVNKPGPEGFLVFGIDGKTGDVMDAPFMQTGLRDITDLKNLVVKFVDLPVSFELQELQLLGKSICVLVLPPSLSKPHFITHYITRKGYPIDNFIPIRKATGVYPATRDDVEFMYYDRKNIEPEYALEIFTHNPNMAVNGSQGTMTIDFQLVFENFGRKPIVIVFSSLTIDPAPDAGIHQEVSLTLVQYSEHSVQERESYLLARFLTVPSNDVQTLMVKYQGNIADDQMRAIRDFRSLTFSVTVRDSHGNEYRSRKFTRGRP